MRSTALIIDDRLARYDQPLFVDRDLQDELREVGFAVRPSLLDPAAIAALRVHADQLLDRLDGRWGDLFLTVGRIEDTALRWELIRRAGDVVVPALAPYFVPETQFLGSAFQVKPPSPTSELNPHQDSSLVDEHQWPGVYGWIPLDDTDEGNGGLQVVPGSHRLWNPQRTLSVPWQLAGLEEVMRRHCVPLAVSAGGVVFFDSATIHCSPPNRSDTVRLAVNSFMRPAGATLLHFFRDEATTPGMVEVFEIDPSFLYGEDMMVRPGDRHRALGERPQHLVDCDEGSFDHLCTEVAARSRVPPSALVGSGRLGLRSRASAVE